MREMFKTWAAWIYRRLDAANVSGRARQLTKSGKLLIGVGTYGLPTISDLQGNQKHKVIIGNYCSIGSGVRIVLGGEHRTDWVTTYPIRFMYGIDPRFDGQPYVRGNVIIKDDVWIGNDVFIRSGTTIGWGAVIGACSVVTRDVLPYEIVAGNPCRHIRMRFTEQQIEALLRIAWWNWPKEKILSNVDLLSNCNIDTFIAKHSE